MKKILLSPVLVALAINVGAQKNSNVISRSFELRYVTNDTKANGETDYKGATEWMDTNLRIDYLHQWQQYASKFFDDPTLAEQVVTADEVREAMSRLKPQPLPQVRRELRLDEWRWAPSKNHFLPLQRQYSFTPQTYCFRMECDIEGQGSLRFMSGQTVACEYVNDGKKHKAVFEVDLSERRYNLKLDGQLAVDFQPLQTIDGTIDGLVVSGVYADNIWGVGYTKTTDTKRLNQPLFAKTFLDVSSRKAVVTEGWTNPCYNDSEWETCTLPKNHGTERHEGEALLLRKWVDVKDYEKAYFELESLFPSGELWVNGKVVEVMKDAHRKIVDVTKYLNPGSKNLLCIKIDPFHANFKQMMHHCPTDPNIGWFAGRAKLHLTKAIHVSDLYAYANNINGDITAEVTVKNTSYTFFRGQLQVLLKDWFPSEGEEFVADSMMIEMDPQQTRTYKLRFHVDNLKMWSVRKPQLYQVRALLVNSESGKKTETFSAVDGDLARTRELYIDKLTDDYVVTTGFRTIEQDGGTFRINGQPELLRAPLYFGQRFPLERDALDLLCPRGEDIMKELLAVKKMNANGMRMSAHWSDDNPQDGTNDPRFTEMAD